MKTFDEARERAEQRGDEYLYGAIETDLAAVPLTERLRYLPDGVLQYNSVMDSNGCASRGPVAIWKAKYTYFYHHGMHPALKEWLKGPHYIGGKPYSYIVGEGADAKVVFDETFIEILSGTTRNGNSLKAPVHATHEHGLIPECLPLEPTMTWEQYTDRNRVTGEMLDLGKEFMRRFTNNYEQVRLATVQQFLDAIKDDYLDLAGHAWPEPKDGVYPRSENNITHVFAGATDSIHAFDSYQPFLKLLARDYKFFDWAYSLSVTAQNPYPNEILTLFETLSRYGLLAFFAAFLEKFTTATAPEALTPPTPVPEPLPPAPQQESLRERLAQEAEARLGDEPTPEDTVPDEVACVSSLVAVMLPVLALDPSLAYTPTLLATLKKDKRFRGEWEPKRGRIVVSPTAGEDRRGHCGIFLSETEIASNNSFGVNRGRWTQNFTWQSWITYFKHERKLPIYIFEPVEE